MERSTQDNDNETENDMSEKSKEDMRICDEFLNYEISMGEVEAALQLLKSNKSPGPDEVFTELLGNAGEELKMAICRLFQRSWNEAVVPSKWKVAEVKFLRKNGKSSYHVPGSYRPISLTSYLCKSMERIVTHRLYGFAEHFNLIDKEQEEFRRFRGTVDALLRLTQDIIDGFNKKESTAALFIDIEKAYDSIWHEGLLYKLKELGIRGRVWEWIKSFLNDRKAVINLAGKRAQEFCIKIGLPQGSVLSQLLFLLFIVDFFKNVSGKKVKFADDGTIWKSGEDWRYLLEELKKDFSHVCENAGRWRVKISMMKTEFCVFSLDNQVLEEAKDYNFSINEHTIKHNPTPKLLGVTLDEKLKFEPHTEKLEHRALKTVSLLRKVKETEGINTKCMLQLYKALVTPQLENAAAVWQIGNCASLEKIQRKGLAVCLGVPGTASLEALEVEAGIKPLDIRREELSVRQAVRIMMKADEDHIKVSWDDFQERDGTEHRVSPFGKMNVQVADMMSNIGITLNSLEKDCNYLESLQPSKQN